MSILIESIDHALSLMNHDGIIDYDGDIYIGGLTRWIDHHEGKDTTGMVIRAKNIYSANGYQLVSFKSLEAQGFIQGFESISAERIACHSIFSNNVHVKYIKAHELHCDTLTLHSSRGSKVHNTHINEWWNIPKDAEFQLGNVHVRGARHRFYIPPDLVRNVADINFMRIDTMPTQSKKSFMC